MVITAELMIPVVISTADRPVSVVTAVQQVVAQVPAVVGEQHNYRTEEIFIIMTRINLVVAVIAIVPIMAIQI
ncbi:hypothetical protein LR61_06735 [Morganella morganii]|nr:hypothetical protein LR61_06735 [Morganella morganii]